MFNLLVLKITSLGFYFMICSLKLSCEFMIKRKPHTKIRKHIYDLHNLKFVVPFNLLIGFKMNSRNINPPLVFAFKKRLLMNLLQLPRFEVDRHELDITYIILHCSVLRI